MRKGDNLFIIAERFHISSVALLWANRYLPDLYPGTRLRVPPVDGVYHRWRAGDDLARVAEEYGVEVADIVSWPGNVGIIERKPGGKGYRIKAGAKLFISGGVTPEGGRSCKE